MALTDFDNYVDRLSENIAADFQMTAVLAREDRLNAAFRSFVPAPTTPTTSIALNKDSAEALAGIPAVSTGSLQLLGARLTASNKAGICVILVDILNVSGGLNATLTTAQTTNLPTAALTRYTSGVGVMAGIIVYTQLGTTATTYTVSYTNQAGTSGRTSTASTIGGTSFREVNLLLPIPLAAGDTGIRSIESVTLAGTTGTIGNFGVCLFKPLAMLSMESFTSVAILDMVSTGGVTGQFAEINSNACLSILAIATSVQAVAGSIILNEV